MYFFHESRKNKSKSDSSVKLLTYHSNNDEELYTADIKRSNSSSNNSKELPTVDIKRSDNSSNNSKELSTAEIKRADNSSNRRSCPENSDNSIKRFLTEPKALVTKQKYLSASVSDIQSSVKNLNMSDKNMQSDVKESLNKPIKESHDLYSTSLAAESNNTPVSSLIACSPRDLRKQVFKTKLRLDIQPLASKILPRLSKLNTLRSISEENDTITLEGGEVVRLRTSSTSSSRSYRGEVFQYGSPLGSASSSSLDASLPCTPDSPTADIDSVFALRQQTTMESPDVMEDVKKLAKKWNFSPTNRGKNEIDIKSEISKTEVATKALLPCIIDDEDPKEETAPNQLTDEERKAKLKTSMEWLRRELTAMKLQDQEIARQLISIRLEIQRLRLQQAVQTHKTILENVALDVEVEKELSTDYCESVEFKTTPYSESAHVRDMGLTKMNLTNRRFSLR